MNKTPLQVIIPTLRNWALRPDAATDLREIFGTEKSQTSSLLDQIRTGDFSWLPTVEVLPSTVMDQAYGAYSRETGTIYLATDCPADLKESVLLEEIGHHIDALFNTTETPGDEGALFSATVRGIPLSDEEITAILNEDDSSIINLHEREIAVECASRRTPTPVGSRTPVTVTTRQPVAPIVTVKPGAKGTITQSGDWVTSDVDYTLNDAPTKRGLSLVGGSNLIGTGNDGGTSKQNTLSAASNTGNTTLIAGTASTTMIGGSGNNWLNATGSQGTVSIQGGSGSSTMLAGNGPATLVGGRGNNSLQAGTVTTRTLGQSLVGGASTSPLFGNTLRGGTGRDTLRSGAGFSTLISGSNPGASTTIGAEAAKDATSIRVASAAGLAVGQQITGNGIAAGTTITAIAGTQLTISARTTASLSAGTRINTVGNILIGQGVSNSLRAGSGNDSLVALSGNSTLLGGVGRTTLLGGAAGSSNSLQSGSTSTGGNTLIGGAGSNTLVAGAGSDSIVGGANQNLLLVTQANHSLIGNDNIRLSSLASASNTLGVSLNAGALLGDALFSGMASLGNTNLKTVQNLSSASTRITLAGDAQRVGVSTLIAGSGSDTLSVASFRNSVLLDASRSSNKTSLTGGAGDDAILGSRGGFDMINGGDGNDLISVQNTSFGTLNGGSGTDTLRLGASALLTAANFNAVSSIEVLELGNGNNAIGSLQGSGIRRIIGNTGSDTLSANVYGAVRAVTRAGSSTVTLNVSGNSPTMGFEVGQVVTGNGIAVGTTIARDGVTTGIATLSSNALKGTTRITLSSVPTSYAVGQTITGTGIASGTTIRAISGRDITLSTGLASTLSKDAQVTNNTVTLTLSKPTTSLISQGGAIMGWIGTSATGSAINFNSGSNTISINDALIKGFAVGQPLVGDGIADKTTIAAITRQGTSNIFTLTLTNPDQTKPIIQTSFKDGDTLAGVISAATLDGAKALGIPATDAELERALKAFTDRAEAITTANFGTPNELAKDTLAISTLRDDPSTFINRKGDYLVAYGQNNLLIGGQGNDLLEEGVTKEGLEDRNIGAVSFDDNSSIEPFIPLRFFPSNTFLQRQVVSNTLVSGAFTSNTLEGGSGANLFLINNEPGKPTALPTIKNPHRFLQSASTIQFIGSGVELADAALSSVGERAAQRIVSANGNNLISIGKEAARIGIQTIIGGVGSDTFVTEVQFGEPVPLSLASDANSGAKSLVLTDVSSLAIGSLITGVGIADKTFIESIDTTTGEVSLSKGISQNLPAETVIEGSPLIPYTSSVYFDASRGSGRQSLASGSGNDTLLAGTGNATLVGGDGNNSLRGGLGNNLIISGIGNSTLDGGFGISTLQADGGLNRFIVRSYNTRILNPNSLQHDPATGQISRPDPTPVQTTPAIGIVDTYVNFDPIQGSPSQALSGPFQFAPEIPDGSPSITKSPSFASSDLSSFYNLQYFNLLGSANYGVGNALDNTISAASANALILGMGGNNTLIASGANSSLYGNITGNYSDPDLYAYAPLDTKTQEFVDGVIGVAGNNSLVANGANSFLDGGEGYNDGLFGSASNTLIGNGFNSTLVQRHQADVLVSGGAGTVFTSVDLYRLPDKVSDVVVVVTPQGTNSGQVTADGQRMTAGYAAVNDATGGYTGINGAKIGAAPGITVENSIKMQVLYSSSEGTTYGADGDLLLDVSDITPDPKDPTKNAVTLTWEVPTTPDGELKAQTLGYQVKYQITASTSLTLESGANAGEDIISVNNVNLIKVGQKLSGTGIEDGTTVLAIDSVNKQITLSKGLTQGLSVADSLTAFANTPYLTYLNGTSQDLTGTSEKPTLQVDNLPSSFNDPYSGTYNSNNYTISYDFQVIAQETVLPAYTDAEGNLIAKPVSLIGGGGDDVIFGDILDTAGKSYSNTRALLNNNPIDPANPGTIETPVPWRPTDIFSGLFPTYLDGKAGNDYLIAPIINDGSGKTFTAWQNIGGVPKSVNFSGINTLVGGFGSDTFVVSNGGTDLDVVNGVVQTSAFDQVIKYGLETPAGQNNLVISAVEYLTLSDTDVSQGKFINQAWAAFSNQYVAGNRLDNTLVAYGLNDTLLGAGGRDSIVADNSSSLASGTNTLIGGTAYGLDSIAGALNDFRAVSLGGNGYSTSIYRDTDPVPVTPNGPGSADNSQYWMVNGPFGPVFDPLRNSDTLVANNTSSLVSAVIDGGAGNDSMVGGKGNDTLYVSNGSNSRTNVISGSDVVVGGERFVGGNDWIVFTGSDTYWSGRPGTTSAILGYTLNDLGDAAEGQSISNIKLQDGSPVARTATGSATSTGNQHKNSGLGEELGSNHLIGNELANTLNGGGVGGINGTGVGVDTLEGGAGADLFVIGDKYLSSDNNRAALLTPSGNISRNNLRGRDWATDADYAEILDFTGIDYLELKGSYSDYVIGSAPSGFYNNNINGADKPLVDNSAIFGIYKVAGTSSPNLVAVINCTEGFNLGALPTGGNYHKVSWRDDTGTLISEDVTGKSTTGIGGLSGVSAAGENYAGFGAMYDLEDTSFKNRVTFA